MANDGFTEITNKSPFTSIRNAKIIGAEDLLHFAEANGYGWNYAHDFLWPTSEYSRVHEGELYLTDVDDYDYHPLAKELLKRFARAYNLTVVWLMPEHLI